MIVTILKGCPGSGKSTWASKVVKYDAGTVIVNRDSIRASLGKYWVPSRENLVTDIEYSMIEKALLRRYNVIIDATNLNKTFLQRLEDHISVISSFNNINVNIIYKEFNVPLWKLVLRDVKRGLFGGRYVGYKVIKSFYDRYYKNTRT